MALFGVHGVSVNLSEWAFLKRCTHGIALSTSVLQWDWCPCGYFEAQVVKRQYIVSVSMILTDMKSGCPQLITLWWNMPLAWGQAALYGANNGQPGPDGADLVIWWWQTPNRAVGGGEVMTTKKAVWRVITNVDVRTEIIRLYETHNKVNLIFHVNLS